jgi:hypothetical protein
MARKSSEQLQALALEAAGRYDRAFARVRRAVAAMARARQEFQRLERRATARREEEQLELEALREARRERAAARRAERDELIPFPPPHREEVADESF